jgi:hypothetical protein
MTKRPSPKGQSPAHQEQRDAAAQMAIAALTFIAAEPERLGRFLAMSGIGPESIRDAARDPQFLVGVLDHIVSDETLLVAFAEQSDIDPEEVMRARESLAGPDWERDTA